MFRRLGHTGYPPRLFLQCRGVQVPPMISCIFIFKGSRHHRRNTKRITRSSRPVGALRPNVPAVLAPTSDLCPAVLPNTRTVRAARPPTVSHPTASHPIPRSGSERRPLSFGAARSLHKVARVEEPRSTAPNEWAVGKTVRKQKTHNRTSCVCCGGRSLPRAPRVNQCCWRFVLWTRPTSLGPPLNLL